jgi:hypothetical protein
MLDPPPHEKVLMTFRPFCGTDSRSVSDHAQGLLIELKSTLRAMVGKCEGIHVDLATLGARFQYRIRGNDLGELGIGEERLQVQDTQFR